MLSSTRNPYTIRLGEATVIERDSVRLRQRIFQISNEPETLKGIERRERERERERNFFTVEFYLVQVKPLAEKNTHKKKSTKRSSRPLGLYVYTRKKKGRLLETKLAIIKGKI